MTRSATCAARHQAVNQPSVRRLAEPSSISAIKPGPRTAEIDRVTPFPAVAQRCGACAADCKSSWQGLAPANDAITLKTNRRAAQPTPIPRLRTAIDATSARAVSLLTRAALRVKFRHASRISSGSRTHGGGAGLREGDLHP